MAEISRSGHRERLRQQIETNGIKSIPEYQVIEYLLFHGIPYKDTKPIAYELINKFGNLAGICSASLAALMDIKDMTYNAALFLRSLSGVFDIYQEQVKGKERLGSVQKIIAFLGKLADPLIEECYVINVDANDEVLSVMKLVSGSRNALTIPTRKIIKHLIDINCRRVVIAHNHPSGIALPSEEDMESTKSLMRMVQAINIELIDHMILCNETAYSILTEKEYRFRLIPKEN